MLPVQVFGVPSNPEVIFILFLLISVPLVAAFLAYRTGRSTGDEHAALWAAVVGVLTVFGLVPGAIALAAYSHVRTT